MRSFRDSKNCEWTVFEVRRQVGRADGPDQPSGTGDGWLCFETSTAKCRLVKYSPRWKEFSDPELERLLATATPAPASRAPWRLNDDAGTSSTGVQPD